MHKGGTFFLTWRRIRKYNNSPGKISYEVQKYLIQNACTAVSDVFNLYSKQDADIYKGITTSCGRWLKSKKNNPSGYTRTLFHHNTTDIHPSDRIDETKLADEENSV